MELIKRQGYRYKIPKEARRLIEERKCPSCGKHKDKWKRRTDWRCCSIKCTTNYENNIVQRWYWQTMREKAFERDNYACVKCGVEKSASLLRGDHIVPIALGGEEFELENVQTLCIPCDKIKTKKDQNKIAKQRRINKLKKGNASLLSEGK
ncbi:MAG TPA: HNH endonuclease [Candidatus Pacearchaeota archaeon]|nr:HNH endonuclease [Candidatus Pacearchaeota archaeon]